jgi:hypothetical protein
MRFSVFIKGDEVYSKPFEYILSVLAKNKNAQLLLTTNKTQAQLIFDHTDAGSLPINIPFYRSLLGERVFQHEMYFANEPRLLFPNSTSPDWLGTAFYMINTFQEYDAQLNGIPLDRYQRFPYISSYQYKFNCIQENLVQECFDRFCTEYLPHIAHAALSRKSKVFLSHDIDIIHGSLLQDGLWALKRGRIDIILRLIMNEILTNPRERNIDKIVKLHSEHDLKSTFFWLATKKQSAEGIKNADYSLGQLSKLSKYSSSNGLHKSAYTTTFEEELKMLPFPTGLNRYHFLKFRLPNAWDDVEQAKLRLDASLGFAEHYGFRNNYGLPFRPYDIVDQKPYSFVEAPLHVMDVTMMYYMKTPTEEMSGHVINFIEKNLENTILSILWHNTNLTEFKYGGYLREYKKILLYLIESGIQSIMPDEIINEFGS